MKCSHILLAAALCLRAFVWADGASSRGEARDQAVLLAEGVELVPEALEAAKEKDICVLSSDKTVYELCAGIAAMLN